MARFTGADRLKAAFPAYFAPVPASMNGEALSLAVDTAELVYERKLSERYTLTGVAILTDGGQASARIHLEGLLPEGKEADGRAALLAMYTAGQGRLIVEGLCDTAALPALLKLYPHEGRIRCILEFVGV